MEPLFYKSFTLLYSVIWIQ